MSHNLLKGKRGIIFGALNDMSIAWKVAERAVEEGAIITLSNTPVAVRMGEVDALSKKLNAEVIAADATSVADLENVFSKSVEILGGKIDFVLHSIGMSPNVRKKRTYDDLDYDMLEKTLDISAVSFHKMLQVAKKQDQKREQATLVEGSGHLSLNDTDGVMIEIIQLTEGLYLILFFADLDVLVGHQKLVMGFWRGHRRE